LKLFRFIPSPSVDKKHSHPLAIKRVVPEWYKNAEKYYMEKGHEVAGLKTCLPFLDALTLGYVLVTPVDIHVSKTEKGELNLAWDNDLISYSIINERKGLIGHTIPRPPGHEENHLIWNSQWGWKVPKGYSVVVTHPLNRHDLPFTTLSGVVDSDGFIAWGNTPFFIKEGFTGIIPAGTPYAQLIPYKRDKWTYIQDWLSMDKAVDVAPALREGKAVYNKLWRKVKEF
jgi:hypothetical protein